MTTQLMYGFFPGGDPRKFQPDEESNTEEEMRAWRNACDAWDLGMQIDAGASCLRVQADGSFALITVSTLGLGIYEYEEPDEVLA